MTDVVTELRDQFGPFWQKGTADGMELNGIAVAVIGRLGLKAADELERLHATRAGSGMKRMGIALIIAVACALGFIACAGLSVGIAYLNPCDCPEVYEP